MAFEEESVVQEWLDHLSDLHVKVKKCLVVIACIVAVNLLVGFMTAS